jgi:hypothetical protein
VDNEQVANPKVLLAVAAVVGFLLSAIAIIVVVSHDPDSGYREVTSTAPATSTRP